MVRLHGRALGVCQGNDIPRTTTMNDDSQTCDYCDDEFKDIFLGELVCRKHKSMLMNREYGIDH